MITCEILLPRPCQRGKINKIEKVKGKRKEKEGKDGNISIPNSALHFHQHLPAKLWINF